MKTPKKYRKKPVVIKAIQFTGKNGQDVAKFVLDGGGSIQTLSGTMVIETLEGNMLVEPSDYIICGIAGEFYPCKELIFLQTYEEMQPLQ